MNASQQIAEGAFFVPSYSEQTVLSYNPLFTNQTIICKEIEEEPIEIYIPGNLDKLEK